MELLTDENREQLRGLAEFLRRPGHMRLTVFTTLAIIAYLGVYEPLLDRHRQLEKDVRQARNRYNQIQNIQTLQAQIEGVRRSFPEDGGTLTWWTRRLVDGAGQQGVDIETLSPNVTDVKIEEFTKVEFQLSVSGTFIQIVRFMVWVESLEPPVLITNVSMSSTDQEPRQVGLTLESLIMKPKTGTGDKPRG